MLPGWQVVASSARSAASTAQTWQQNWRNSIETAQGWVGNRCQKTGKRVSGRAWRGVTEGGGPPMRGNAPLAVTGCQRAGGPGGDGKGRKLRIMVVRSGSESLAVILRKPNLNRKSPWIRLVFQRLTASYREHSLKSTADHKDGRWHNQSVIYHSSNSSRSISSCRRIRASKPGPMSLLR